jgi:hypothetical protein
VSSLSVMGTPQLYRHSRSFLASAVRRRTSFSRSVRNGSSWTQQRLSSLATVRPVK